MTKKIIPCLFLLKEEFVKGFKDASLLSDNPVDYVINLAVNGADAVIIFDLSDNDEDHEKALLMINKITKATDVFVYGTGNIKDLEDVRKLIYAGCRAVALNITKQLNIDLLEEAGKLFSKQKILVCADAKEQLLDNLKFLKENTCGCILLDSLCVNNFDEMPVIPVINDDAVLFEILRTDCVYGVSGDVVNNKGTDLIAFKEELLSEGIEVDLGQTDITWDLLKKDDKGLVPVVTQDVDTGDVLMVAYMNEESYKLTLKTGIMTYYSRSRKCLWKKGDTSGHYQYVKSLFTDCDSDTILAKVVQIGAACHTGARSCFFNEIVRKDYAGL